MAYIDNTLQNYQAAQMGLAALNDANRHQLEKQQAGDRVLSEAEPTIEQIKVDKFGVPITDANGNPVKETVINQDWLAGMKKRNKYYGFGNDMLDQMGSPMQALNRTAVMAQYRGKK